MALSEGRRRRRSTRALLGYLEVHVFEASPRGLKKTMGVQRISSAWKALVPGMSEVLCRVEISGIAAQRAETAIAKVGKASIAWDEKMTLPVYEGAKELRLLLLASSKGDAPPKTIANGGFYVEDIMASPSNCKWFELFAPGGSAGGTIKLSILYTAAVPSEDHRRHSVNAETQMEASTGSAVTGDQVPTKSGDAAEAAINTDPIADSPPSPPTRRSMSVAVGVGPSPVASTRNSPAAAGTQRRVSRQRRTSAPPEPRATVDARETPPPAPSVAPPPAAPIEQLGPTLDATARETAGGSREEGGEGAAATASDSVPLPCGPSDRIHHSAAEPADQVASEEREAVPGNEAAPTDDPVAAVGEEMSRDDTSASAIPAVKPAGGGAPLLLLGVTAVAALVGALVLGSRRGGTKSRSGNAVEHRRMKEQ